MLATVAALVLAQTTSQSYDYVARTADIKDPDAIIGALYDVISGPAGQKRNWPRFKSLFTPTGSLTAVVKRRDGNVVAVAMTQDDYINRSGPILERDGFFEKETNRKTDTRGNIMHVWSEYESRMKADDEKPFAKGTNSIQLFTDGKRWYIQSVLWE